jgi:hypothetical protein
MVNLFHIVNGALMPMNNFKTPMVPGGTMPLVNSAGAIGATGMFNGGAIGMGMVTGGIPAQQLKPPGAISMTGAICMGLIWVNFMLIIDSSNLSSISSSSNSSCSSKTSTSKTARNRSTNVSTNVCST